METKGVCGSLLGEMISFVLWTLTAGTNASYKFVFGAPAGAGASVNGLYILSYCSLKHIN